MIFNKNGKGNDELRELTGNYYNNNNFSKMPGHILLATAELKKLIGAAVYQLAETAYNSTEPSHDNADLIPYVQLPIAILATFNMYRENDISHEDSGRKVKIDATTEKIPWQWQLKADDEIQMDKYYSAVDALIAYLDESGNSIWAASDFKKTANSLLINTVDKFDRYYPINKSGRIYILLLPFIREVETLQIKRHFGTDYARYVAASNLTEKDKSVLEYVYPAIPLLAMSLAVRRLPLGVIPSGVVRNYQSKSITQNASDAPPASEIQQIMDWMEADAEEMIEMAKIERNNSGAFQMLPLNDVRNKGMRV